MTSAVPPFSSNADRYDQSTFYGRFRKMVDVVDPRSLTCTAADRERAQGLLRGHKDGTLASGQATDTELWAAKKLVDATIHPDTGELIPMPFRMSGFVPFNGPICLGALLATSPGGIFFWHWCVCLISRRARRGRRRRWGGVGWWNEGGGGDTVVPLCTVPIPPYSTRAFSSDVHHSTHHPIMSTLVLLSSSRASLPVSPSLRSRPSPLFTITNILFPPHLLSSRYNVNSLSHTHTRTPQGKPNVERSRQLLQPQCEPAHPDGQIGERVLRRCRRCCRHGHGSHRGRQAGGSHTR